jgi:hypothetical protein
MQQELKKYILINELQRAQTHGKGPERGPGTPQTNLHTSILITGSDADES